MDASKLAGAGRRRSSRAARASAALLSVFLAGGCASPPADVEVNLERSLFPDLGELGATTISEALDRRVELHAPFSAGLVWLTADAPLAADASADSAPAPHALSEFQRTGVVALALATLRTAPFGNVGALPTVPADLLTTRPARDPVAVIRKACANFQYDVALILQTGAAENSGLNVLALGYVPLVTAPLFPGSELAVATSAEIVAIDVRTGAPIAVGRGRDASTKDFVFPWQVTAKSAELMESSLGRSITFAAGDLVSQLALRSAAK